MFTPLTLCDFLADELVREKITLRVLKMLDFFVKVRDNGVYRLSEEHEIDTERVLPVLANGTPVSCVKLVSFDEFGIQREQCHGQAPAEQRIDDSVRGILLQREALSRRAFNPYPDIGFIGEGATRENRLRFFLYQRFLDRCTVHTEQGCQRVALYWYDAMKILESCLRNILTVAEVSRFDEGRVLSSEVFLRSEGVLSLLQNCVPLGWKKENGNGSTIIVLCK